VNKHFSSPSPLRSIEAFVEHAVRRSAGAGLLRPLLHCVDGVHFVCVRHHALLYVLACAHAPAAAFAVDLLAQIARVFDDYCGTGASEESLRLNVVLLHELLDDMLDTGVVQTLATARLRAQLFNEASLPGAVAPSASELLLSSLGLAPADPAAAAAAAAARPLAVHRISGSGAAAAPGDALASPLSSPDALSASSASVVGVGNDINAMYVDVRERLTLALDVDGRLRRSDVAGEISLLSTVRGSPLVRLRLGDSVQLRSAAIGAAVARDAWNSERTLQLHADSGRATVLRYRAALLRTATTSGGVPLQLAGRVSLEPARNLLCLRLRLRACVQPTLFLADVVVRVHVPHATLTADARCVARRNGAANDSVAAFEPPRAAGERATLVWRTERVYGGAEILLAVDAPLDASGGDDGGAAEAAQLRDELSPLLCSGVCSGWLASGIDCRLTVADALSDTQSPRRWIASETVVELTREFEWAA
jgi:hypothetical protein